MARGTRKITILNEKEKNLLKTIKEIYNTKFVFKYATELANKLVHDVNSLSQKPKNFVDNLFNRNIILEYQEEIERADSRKEKVEYKVFHDSQDFPSGDVREEINIIISDSCFEKKYFFEFFNYDLIGLRSPPKKQIPQD